MPHRDLMTAPPGEVQRQLTGAHAGRGVAFEIIPTKNARPRHQRPSSLPVPTASSDALLAAEGGGEGADGGDGVDAQHEAAREDEEFGRSYTTRPDRGSRKKVWSKERGRYKAEHLELAGLSLTYESAVDVADFHDYELFHHDEDHKVVSFRDGDYTVRIDVYYSTRTVGTALFHPRQGRTSLFARNVDLKKLQELMENRKHIPATVPQPQPVFAYCILHTAPRT